MKKQKPPGKRNPIAKATSKMRTKVKPDKKRKVKNIPNGDYTYNKHPLFDGDMV